MGIFDFMKKDKEDKQVDRIIGEINQNREVRKAVDKAISLRRLNRYPEAIELLKKTIQEYPFYKPTLSILGNTYLGIGQVDAAENIFRNMIDDCNSPNDRLLKIEAYSNLGNLYYEHKKDKNKAIQYYEKAIVIIEPKSVGDYESKNYNAVLAGAFMGLSKIYALENDIEKAKNSALKCIKLQPTNVFANRIYGIMVANTMLSMEGTDIFKNNDIIIELKQAKDSLAEVFGNDDSDIDALYTLNIILHTIYMLKGSGKVPDRYNIEQIDVDDNEFVKYSHILKDLSHQSEDAKEKDNFVQEYMARLLAAQLELSGYKVRVTPCVLAIYHLM